MISFASDYTTGMHPKILEAYAATNLEPLPGYGMDAYSFSAAEKIRTYIGKPEAEVFFLTGGTQTNETVISTMLEPWQGVIAAGTGHIQVHEAGAVEYTGHKVLCLPSHTGLLDPSEVEAYIKTFYQDESHDHMVFPGMIYISYPSEMGTLYTKEMLTRLYDLCKIYDMKLFIDGARLGYGLASPAADMTMQELAGLCDVFYIGGTKVGAPIGEAVVFCGCPAPRHFITMVKQHGAMLAKGRMTGIPFDVLFTDDLYMQISRHAMEMAEQLKMIFQSKRYAFAWTSPTNQQFVILPNEQIEALRGEVDFSVWEPADETHSVVRFATSWSTTVEDLEKLDALL